MSLQISVTLVPQSGSFCYAAKRLELTSTPLILGAESSDRSQHPPASQTNGWFKGIISEDPIKPDILPLSLSERHAQIWFSSTDSRVYIQDLSSAFGTFLNGSRITQPTALKSGDIITLGTTISRSANTPSYITDHHLKPVIAELAFSCSPSLSMLS
ncbi:hypothetical protein FA15DRAFT_757195 [Coprinopsis marcescibilis]|uniref:FHA domain-containing protein n=1 Tax=Coprinopsis marcescibilis TaxID=230819 RepID=A0A5C3KTJ9_COPMA|nr:hypothetical protein FA15DRAFT_757195 [Coprinopsis marcescibilis]